jgi:hypothetical protein
MLNPIKRLGCGTIEEGNDFSVIRKHPFFDGFDFENFST